MRIKSIYFLLILVIASCSYIRPEQSNFYLVKVGGSRAEFKQLANGLAKQLNADAKFQTSQWDSSNYTDTFTIKTEFVNISMSNALRSCIRSLDNSVYSVFVSVYARSSGSEADIRHHEAVVKGFVRKRNWMYVTEEHCNS